MKSTVRILLAATLILNLFNSAQAQEKDYVKEPTKYKGCHTLTHFDSTKVFMEESGLSRVEYHKRFALLDYTGCKENNVVKMDYDPLSAYVEIRQVLVHRYYSGNTDTIVGTENGERRTGKVVYDYVAPARLIYWGASQ